MGPLGSGIARATATLDRLMLRKSPAEIRAFRRAAALADEGYAVFREAARVGRPEYALVADVEAFFRSRGCPENFQILGAGGKEVRGMHPPGERCLVPGDLVTTELTPCVDGYYAQICRTLVLGQPSETQKRAFAVYNEALERGIAAVRTGATAGDVARAQNEVFRRQGLGDYVTSVYTRVRGHGLGLYVDGRPALHADAPRAVFRSHRLVMRRGLISWSREEVPAPVLERRVARLQNRMRDAGLGAVLVYTSFARPSAVAWLTHFVPYWNEALLVIFPTEAPVLLAAFSNRVHDWIRSVSHLGEVRSAPDLGPAAAAFLKERSPEPARIGVIELDALPWSVAEAMAKPGSGVELVDATGVFASVRQPADESEVLLARR